MYFTLYFLVTRLPDSLRSVRDHFLALDPTALTVDDFETQLLAAEKNILAVGAARGTPRTPLFEGCSPSPLAPSYASAAAAVDFLGAEEVGAASAPSGKRRSTRGRGAGGEVQVAVEGAVVEAAGEVEEVGVVGVVAVVVEAAVVPGAVAVAAAVVGEEPVVVAAVVARASSSSSSSSSDSARPPRAAS
ncbi:unnamed protein product [Closterium sp. Yama58-4]|nr:unnamed protein product [Closterium sp. Yama58-4]